MKKNHSIKIQVVVFSTILWKCMHYNNKSMLHHKRGWSDCLCVCEPAQMPFVLGWPRKLCNLIKLRVLLSPYPNEFLSRKNNSIVKDALFDFILNSNKKLWQKSNNNSHLHQFSNQSVFTSKVYTLKYNTWRCHFQFVPFDKFTSSWILPLWHHMLKRQ